MLCNQGLLYVYVKRRCVICFALRLKSCKVTDTALTYDDGHMPSMTDTPIPYRKRFAFLAGFIAGPTVGLLLLAALARYLPDRSVFQVIGRVADSVAPQMLVVVVGLALVIALLGAWRSGLLIVLGAVVAAGYIGWKHTERTIALVPEASVDLRVLWFNMLNENWLPPEEIAAGLVASGADVVVLGEAVKITGQMRALREVFPFQVGCLQFCAVVMLSKYPLEAARQGRLSPISPERYIRARVVTEAGEVTLIGSHLIKPWFDRLSTDEAHRLSHRIEVVEGPVVLVGDMNAAPWSRRMVHLHQDTGLRFAPLPPATWPARAGALGVPIDHVMIGGGAGFVSLLPWGADMGSNHLGLLAEITLDAPQPSGN